MDEQKFIARLLARKATLAQSALESPTGENMYHYGYAVGVQKGLSIALAELKAMLAEDKEMDL